MKLGNRQRFCNIQRQGPSGELMHRKLLVIIMAATLCAGFAGYRIVGAGQESQKQEKLLAEQFAAALAGRQYDRAIEIGQRLVEVAPQNEVHAYNLACALAKAERNDEACRWLQISADRGFRFLATLQRDEDLEPLRESAAYQQALATVRANSDRDLEQFKQQVQNVEPLIVLPPDHDPKKPAPLIVALHPTGGSASQFAGVWTDIAADFNSILVLPQGRLRVADGWRWGKVEHGEWLVLQAIEKAKAAHAIDPRRIVVTGFSEGGSISFIVALRNPSAVAAAIPICGEYVPQVSPAAPTPEGNVAPRICIITGQFDRDVESNRAALRDIKKAGWPVELHEIRGMGHALPPNHRRRLADALKWAFSGG